MKIIYFNITEQKYAVQTKKELLTYLKHSRIKNMTNKQVAHIHGCVTHVKQSAEVRERNMSIGEMKSKETNINMTQGKPMRLLFSFALPLMFGNVFQQLYTVTDTAIVGRGVGMDALAALGSVDWLNWMMLGIAQGFAQGFSVRIAQKFGEGNLSELKKYVAQSAILAAVIALACLVAGQLGMDLFLFLLRVPADLKPMAELYSRILFAGIPAVMFYNYCSAVLRAVGDSKTPLKAMIVASITNILLDLAAVFVMHWGIAGAAAATVFAQCLAGVICCRKICKTKELNFGRAELTKDEGILRNLIAIGSPAAAKNVIISLGGMIVSAIVNGFGMSFIAGFTASNKLYGLLEIAAISYGYAITTYVGQNYGAGKIYRIKEGMVAAVTLAVSTSLVIAGCMIAFGRSITMLFISSDVPELVVEAGNIAYTYLCVMAAFLPVLYLLYVYLSALQGLGDTVKTMISGIVEFVLRAIISVTVGFIGFEMGIFGAEVTAWIGAAVYLMYHYRKKIAGLQITSSVNDKE